MPSHHKTYNLSLLDRIVPNTYTDFVFYYPKYMNNVNTNVLKQSLSQSLAIYYPLAGRLPSPSASYVDCNDEGIDFVEFSADSRLSDLLQVQLNHFSDGGVAVAVSVSHKIADGLTVASFVNHWATVARGESPIDPTFISSPASNSTEVVDEYDPDYTSEVIYKKRTFTFTNSKLNELKKNVIAMGNTPMNPTRFEVLASLLFKCAVGASTNKSYDSSLLYQPFNVRGIIAGKYPETTVAQYWTNMLSTLDQGRVYTVTSLCTFPFYNANYGWGKPLKVTMDIPELYQGVFALMDTPSGDGIEVTARLREDEMAIFENDKEILAYVQEDV
nr:hypothetical protein [Tanacetum cinerariifolium]